MTWTPAMVRSAISTVKAAKPQAVIQAPIKPAIFRRASAPSGKTVAAGETSGYGKK